MIVGGKAEKEMAIVDMLENEVCPHLFIVPILSIPTLLSLVWWCHSGGIVHGLQKWLGWALLQPRHGKCIVDIHLSLPLRVSHYSTCPIHSICPYDLIIAGVWESSIPPRCWWKDTSILKVPWRKAVVCGEWSKFDENTMYVDSPPHPFYTSSPPISLPCIPISFLPQITFPDFIIYELLDQHHLFEPTILDKYQNLKVSVCMWVCICLYLCVCAHRFVSCHLLLLIYYTFHDSLATGLPGSIWGTKFGFESIFQALFSTIAHDCTQYIPTTGTSCHQGLHELR